MKDCHKQRVSNYVGESGSDRYIQPKRGLFCGRKQALEFKLKDVGGDRQQDDASVGHAVRQKLPVCAKHCRDRAYKSNAENGEQDAAYNGCIDHEGKETVCRLLFSLAEGFCDKRTPACPEHKAE